VLQHLGGSNGLLAAERPQDLANVVVAGDAKNMNLPDPSSLAGLAPYEDLRAASKFERTGDTDDLDRATRLGEGLTALPGDRSDKGAYVSALAGVLLARFERTNRTDALNRAIDLFEQALARISA